MKKFLAVSRAAGALLSLAVPSIALAQKHGGGGILTAPEFDATAAGTVAAIVIGGAFLILRRRRS